MDVALLTAAVDAGAGLDGVAPGHLHEPVDPVEEAGHGARVEVAGRRPRQDALEEQRLARPERPHARERALVQEGLADGSGVCREGGARALRVPVGPEDVGAEMADEVRLPSRRNGVEQAQPEAERGPPLGPEGGPEVVATQVPLGRRSRRLDPPLPLHPQVGVDSRPGVEPVEEVLAPADDLGRRGADEVEVGEAGPAQLGEQQRGAGQGLVQPSRRAPHRVTLGHRPPTVGPSQVLPWSSAEPQSAWGRSEPGGLEGGGDGVRGPQHRASVRLLDGEPAEGALADGEGEGVGRGLDLPRLLAP